MDDSDCGNGATSIQIMSDMLFATNNSISNLVDANPTRRKSYVRIAHALQWPVDDPRYGGSQNRLVRYFRL